MAISAKRVSERLAGSAELALLDVREQGVHYRGHPFYRLLRAALAPGADDRRPGAAQERADRRAGRRQRRAGGEVRHDASHELGYADVSMLEGGCAGWKEAGLELFSGVNVPSKAFGEFVEHHYETPRIPARELLDLQAKKQKMVILDSRPFEEYRRMNIPGGIDVPGAELAWRVHDLAPDPDTLVVVNCAGRTRSIIGCQSLRNAGIPNRVVALKDGTMGWDLAGLECERGSERVAAPPSSQGRDKALAAARAGRFALRREVRIPQAGRGVACRSCAHAVPARRAHPRGVREVAHRRLAPRAGRPAGAGERRVRRRAQRARRADRPRARARGDDRLVAQPDGLERRLRARRCFRLRDGIRSAPLRRASRSGRRPPASDGATVLDLSTSLRFYHSHVPGAWWGVRSRLR